MYVQYVYICVQYVYIYIYICIPQYLKSFMFERCLWTHTWTKTETYLNLPKPLQYLESFMFERCLWITMEFMDAGSLTNLLQVSFAP
jgi:hypothetical protein